MSFDRPISIRHSSCTNPDYGTCEPPKDRRTMQCCRLLIIPLTILLDNFTRRDLSSIVTSRAHGLINKALIAAAMSKAIVIPKHLSVTLGAVVDGAGDEGAKDGAPGIEKVHVAADRTETCGRRSRRPMPRKPQSTRRAPCRAQRRTRAPRANGSIASATPQ